MLKKVSPPFLGFLQASGLVTYLGLITTFLHNISKVFNSDVSEFMAPIIMLMLFVMSAVISATIVLGKAGVLFWERKYKDAFTVIAWTVGWGIFYVFSLIVILYLNK